MKNAYTFAINADLTVDCLNQFSEPSGDEFAFGVGEDEMFSVHPHAVALRKALAEFGATDHDFEVTLAKANGPTRISLTCTDPDDMQSYTADQNAIIEAAGLVVADGISDESGDHALVKSA
ncbi:MAG: hypothetical protein IT466_08780 [Moraxellaceae bacterium]|nr:hypothetical protein [Moraxellaceae bacterium]